MNDPPRYILTRNEFLLLVFTLLTAGVISEAQASNHVYGVAGFGESMYGGSRLF